MIYVTKTFLPPKEDYNALLESVWETSWLTNRGALVLRLEEQLKTYLNVPHLLAMTNGTLPLQIAIKALNISGDIITTPFSYVATTSSICWEGCKPIFVDIDTRYLTIDETKIEASITDNTQAILATHVFGNPCALDTIEHIARKHNLKVIYDAAHCFGVTYKGESVFNYGDVSTCSFHATKLFHTGEGGAVITTDKTLYDHIFHLHNFGHKGDEDFHGIGINGKMSELQAAMGLAVFPYIEEIINKRKVIVEAYKKAFQNIEAIRTLKIRPETQWNYSYFPVIFNSENQLLQVKTALEDQKIYPRRYFYPALDTLNYVDKANCPISDAVSARVLCLPLFVGLTAPQQDRIIEIIINHI